MTKADSPVPAEAERAEALLLVLRAHSFQGWLIDAGVGYRDSPFCECGLDCGSYDAWELHQAEAALAAVVSSPATPEGGRVRCEACAGAGSTVEFSPCRLCGGAGYYRTASPPATPEGGRSDVGTEFVQQVEAYERGDLDEPLAAWEQAVAPSPASPAETREGTWEGLAQQADNLARAVRTGADAMILGSLIARLRQSLLDLSPAASPAVSLPGEAERQVAAVRIALDIESWVIERGAHDRGIQRACARIRAALDDPESFLNPQPALAAPALPGEQPGGEEP
jgi:hypothetical protein